MSEEQAAAKIPQTLEELKAFASEHNIPLEKIHMYLDQDYPWPKAYGIYRDGDEFVVYKNKANGVRAIRYRGKDEAYAVKEIYLKMREMGMMAKAANTMRSYDDPNAIETIDLTGSDSEQNWNSSSHTNNRVANWRKMPGIIIGALCLTAGLFIMILNPNHRDKYERGYYRYQDSYYYTNGSEWFSYDYGYWNGVSVALVEDIIADYDAYSIDISSVDIDPCYYTYAYDDDDRWDNDDWFDDNDWDYDFDNDWDWDSDW